MSPIVPILALCATARAEAPDVHVAVNPLAALTLMDNTVGRYILPMFSNLEYGPSLSAGLTWEDRHALALRGAFGTPNDGVRIAQLHVSYAFFARPALGGSPRGPHLGASARLWRYADTHTDVVQRSLIPQVDVGWWFQPGRAFVDVTLGEALGAYSASSLEHTGARFAFQPFFPMLRADVGWTW